MKPIASFITVCCLAALPALAQPSFLTGYVGAGFTEPLNPLGSHLDTGWNISAGAGTNFNPHFGLMLDFLYDHNDINSTSLQNIGAPNGDMHLFAFSLNPVVHLAPKESPVDVYITGGGGVYHRTIEFTQPTLVGTTFFSPWFGFYPGVIAANQVIGSFTVVKPGFNVGAGAEFRLGSSHTKLFAEARYHRMFITNSIDTTILPVTFGVRW
jgi:opacity protein-like surface antigen